MADYVEKVWTTKSGLKAVVAVMDMDGISKHRCGYVRVPPTHSAFRAEADVGGLEGVSVHGGITFSGSLARLHGTTDEWWLGFDCAHAGDASFDVSPRIASLNRGVVRTLEYVEAECERMAAQLAAIK